MTLDEFNLIPRQLGWKYEYWDGAAHITPSHVVVECRLDIDCRVARLAHAIEPVTPQHRYRLIDAYCDAFEAAPDYLDWPQESFTQNAVSTIDNYFAGVLGEPSALSRLVLQEGDVIGAALVILGKDRRYTLQPVFVRSAWQRSGVATVLAEAVMGALCELGQSRLYSAFLLANAASRSWHRRVGFVEIPNEMLTRHCLQQLRCKVWRLQTLGELRPETERALTGEQARLEAELHELTEARMDAAPHAER